MSDDRSLEFFYRALHASLGYVISTNNPRSLIQEFHRARRRMKKPEFDNLSFVARSEEVWILKESVFPQGVPRKKASEDASQENR